MVSHKYTGESISWLMHKVGRVCTRIATTPGFRRLHTDAAVHEFSQIALATLQHTAWYKILGSRSAYKFMEKFILVRHLPVIMALAVWGPALGGDDHREVLRKLLRVLRQVWVEDPVEFR